MLTSSVRMTRLRSEPSYSRMKRISSLMVSKGRLWSTSSELKPLPKSSIHTLNPFSPKRSICRRMKSKSDPITLSVISSRIRPRSTPARSTRFAISSTMSQASKSVRLRLTDTGTSGMPSSAFIRRKFATSSTMCRSSL